MRQRRELSVTATTISSTDLNFLQSRHTCRCSDSTKISAFALRQNGSHFSEEGGSYASRFYRFFLESLWELSFFSRGSARFDWHSFVQLLAWRSLLWLSMTWRQRFSTQKCFLSTTSLAWSLALHIYCFVQSGEAIKVNGNKHSLTHTHAQHTHII